LRALVLSGPDRLAVVDGDEPRPGPHDALVAPEYVGLCGTDLELVRGTMPYFASGDAAYPLRPGHEIVGRVLDCADRSSLVGRAVVVDPVIGCGRCPACAAERVTWCVDRQEVGVRRGRPGGAAALVAVPSANLHPVPEGLSPRTAVLAEPGVTVLHAIERVGDVKGANALVVGAGTLGLLAAQLLSARDATVEVLDRGVDRRAVVDRTGATLQTDVRPGAYDVVIEAAGIPAGVAAAVDAAAPGAQIAVTGVHGQAMAAVDSDALVLKDLTVHGIFNGGGRYDAVLRELAGGAVDADALIDGEFALDDARAAFERLADPARPRPKVLLRVGSPA
jgi:2-desacetyl-2-hydroxyethyl bacteriochlorophyllide A dehydrogenase